MSNIEQIDFSTLIWVKKELDETLKRAQSAIEKYVEDPEDENQLQFCATYLHQVQGTLKMVELYGAAMVAEEMEEVAKKILAKEVDSEKDSFEVLMRGIILLPDYLERIQLGYKDIPMVLLPLVNDLRTVKGDQLLSESALFKPDLSLGLPKSNLTSSFSLSHNQLVQVVKKIRSAYMSCLLNWLKGVKVEENLKKLQIIVDKLKTVLVPIEEKQLFWVAGGLFEGLISGGLEKSVTVKQLAGKLDQAIRLLTSQDENKEKPYKELTNNLLYYVALADSKDRRISEIQKFFKLSDFISDDKEIEQAQSSLSGKNRELLETVTNVIKEDLMSIQENLDLYNRNKSVETSDLVGIVSSLSKISDTLGIIGVGVARSKIQSVIDDLEVHVKQESPIDKETIMHVAETLLYVESSLDDNILALGHSQEGDEIEDDSNIPLNEVKKIIDSLAKESINNLQKIKQSFILYIEAPWNKESIEESPKLLRDISGALKISGFDDVALQVSRIENFTNKYMIDSDYKPSVDQLDLLAESVASLEYYLEYLSTGTKGENSILVLAKSNIDSLYESVEKSDINKKERDEINQELESFTDDDFDMDLDDEDDVDDSDIDFDDEEDYDHLLTEEVINEDKEEKSDKLLVLFSEDTDDDIKEVFLEEFEEELEHLNSIFPRWKKSPEDQVELLGEIRRIYHTLKGSGRLVGAMAIGDFSWKIEELTNMVLNNSIDVSDSYIQIMERSSELLPDLYEALKTKSYIPNHYNEILSAAEKVINGETIQESDLYEKATDSETSGDEITLDQDVSSEEKVTEDISSEKPVTDVSNEENIEEDDLSVDPVFVEILQQEVEGHLKDVSIFIDHAKDTDNTKSTEKFVRVIHTLNGAANMASVKSIVEMTSPLEYVAKLTNELNLDFDNDTLDKISEFQRESSSIMKDLSNKADSYEATAAISLYFKQKLVDLEKEKELIEINENADYSMDDFDLSKFIDEPDVEKSSSEVSPEEELQIEASNDEVSEEDDLLEFDLSDDILLDDSSEDEQSIEVSTEETKDDGSEDEALEHDLLEFDLSEDNPIDDESSEDDQTTEDSIEETAGDESKDETLEHDLLDFDLSDDFTDDVSSENELTDDDTAKDTKEDESEDESEDETLELDLLDFDLSEDITVDDLSSENEQAIEDNTEETASEESDDDALDHGLLEFDLSEDISVDGLSSEDEQTIEDNTEETATEESEDEKLEHDLLEFDLSEDISVDGLSSEDEQTIEDSTEETAADESEALEHDLLEFDLSEDISIDDEQKVEASSEEITGDKSEEALEDDLLDLDLSEDISIDDEARGDEQSVEVSSEESGDEESKADKFVDESIEDKLDEINLSEEDLSDDESIVEENSDKDITIEDSEEKDFERDLLEIDLSAEDITTDEFSTEEPDKVSDISSEEEALEEDLVEVDLTHDDKSKDEKPLKEETVNDGHISAVISTSYEDKVDSEHKESSNEFDDELLEIFKEEADDILDRTEHVLSDLEENPKDSTLILALQRDLHTLKGGARMAGLENIGNLSHVLESLLENIGEENKTVDNNILGVIHNSFDSLNKMTSSDDFGLSYDVSTAISSVENLVGIEEGMIPQESKLDQDYFKPVDPLNVKDEETEAQEDQTSEVIKSKKQSNVLSGNQIKVNSELLDNLVNYAGEVSIYRSRLEQEIGSFRVNLSELGNTVARIREQLRKLDLETEAQIISTFHTESGDDESFDPLEMDRFSQLQQLSRSLTESISDLSSIHSYLDDVARTSDSLLSQQSRVNTELQDGLMKTRLVSFNSIVPRLRRLVRTTSDELNKPVKLEVHGAEGEMDKTVLEGVIAPLEHMLRNSLAHGIEADRSKAKKDERGKIIIDVRREATEVVISIVDDGAGIDRKKVRKLALDKGLIKKGARISEENIDRLILHSGFSTATEVSKLAGRGVGMDVVSNQINILGGSLDISSEPNVGTKFGIRLPYTLALSSALLVEISETLYAIPVSGLEGIIRMSYPDYMQKIKDKEFNYEYANENYQLQELNTLLDIESEVVVEHNQIPLVMIRSGDSGVALRVDRILGSREIVVKTVGSQISSVPGIYGATILGDGNVVLILDIIPLSRSYETKLANRDESELVEEQIVIEKDPVIMIVDDSITMRKVGERILRRNDYDVVTAKDGLDALDHLKEGVPDVMLLDIEMPRMDGYELAIEMKKDEKYANIPIIMITSRTGDKHRQKAMDLGVDRYLGKPYQEADLLENISELIESVKQE
jgi:chemosensory pili system protein ChpA (sensor histidine kinase/response regulator)